MEGTEGKRPRERDGLGAHRRGVSQNPADPRVRTTVRLDRGRMVVALDAQRVCMVVVEFHDAGVAAVDRVGRLDREDELLEEDFGGFVATMLGPRLAQAL